MQFRSYTYDSTEIDIQYALDAKGKEIREIQLDGGFSGEVHPLSLHFSSQHKRGESRNEEEMLDAFFRKVKKA